MCVIDWQLREGEEIFELSKADATVIDVKVDAGSLFEDYAKQLYEDRKVDAKTQQRLWRSQYEPLKKAIEEGSGGPIVKVEYGAPNFEMLKNLQVNVGVFATFKNHAMMKEVVGLLKDAVGNLKPRDTFMRDALAIDQQYRKDWLATEYDTAVRSARTATIWAKAQDTKRLYPNAEYIHTVSQHPDPGHEEFVGIIRPIDDPFWMTHWPPNRWRCKCSVRVTDKDTTDIPNGLPAIDPAFAFNPGKTGQAFDLEKTQYIKSVSAAEQPALIKQARKEVNKDIVRELPYKNEYTSKSGGKVDAHPLSFDNADFTQALAVARSLANEGHDIKLLPDINDPLLRKELLPEGIKGNKNPAYLINGKWVADLKTVNEPTQTAVHDALANANRQCNNIILNVSASNTISAADLKQYIKGKLNHKAYDSFDNVWVRYRGQWYFTNREDILNGKWPTP